MAHALGSDASLPLEPVVAVLRSAFALMVVVMAVVFAPASRPAALAAAGVALAYSVYSALVPPKVCGPEQARRAERRSVALDVVIALATYLLFMRDPHAMPIAFVLLLVFELAARFGTRGVLAAGAVMGAALGGRIYLQLRVLEGGAVRPDVLLLWLTMAVLMACLGHEYRAREREHQAALRERARIAESFRATVEQVLAHFGARPGSATLGEVERALGEVCSERQVERQLLTSRLAELIATARDELGLTRREQEIASLLARGYPDARIAAELFVSQSTVRNHIHHIKTKLGLKSREDLIGLLRGNAHRLAGQQQADQPPPRSELPTRAPALVASGAATASAR